MKKFIYLAITALLFSVTSLYANNTGCGLGSHIFRESPKTTLIESLAVTTNGLSSNQTFGITFGTLGCEKRTNFVFADKKQEMFVAANMPSLSEDISRGTGEYLTAYSQLLGCPQASLNNFSGTVKANYNKIVVDSATPADVVIHTKEVVLTNPELAVACTTL